MKSFSEALDTLLVSEDLSQPVSFVHGGVPGWVAGAFGGFKAEFGLDSGESVWFVARCDGSVSDGSFTVFSFGIYGSGAEKRRYDIRTCHTCFSPYNDGSVEVYLDSGVVLSGDEVFDSSVFAYLLARAVLKSQNVVLA